MYFAFFMCLQENIIACFNALTKIDAKSYLLKQLEKNEERAAVEKYLPNHLKKIFI